MSVVRTGAWCRVTGPGDHRGLGAGSGARLQLTAVLAGVISLQPGLQTAGCLLCSLCLHTEAGLHQWLEAAQAGVHKGASIPLHFTTRPQYYYSRTNQTTCPSFNISREAKSFDTSVLSQEPHYSK